MNTDRLYYLLTEYIQGNLDRDLALELKAELQHRGENPDDPEGLRELSEKLEQMRIPDPSEQLKDNFYTLLSREQKRQNSRVRFSISEMLNGFDFARWLPRLAYAMVFLLFGYIIGNSLLPINDYRQEMQTMADEIQQVRQVMMLSMIDEPMAAERIKAINTSQYLVQPDDKIIDALLNTLNSDPNENVRLAAVDALLNLSADQKVRKGLLESIPKQESPMMQITLADGMVALNEKEAVPQFQQLLENKPVNDMAKEKIEQAIQKLS